MRQKIIGFIGIFDEHRLKAIVVVFLLILNGWYIYHLQQLNNSLTEDNNHLTLTSENYIREHTKGTDTEFIAKLNPADVHLLINAERHKSGLSELDYDERLERSACAKADDMILRNYWSHADPDGKTAWHLFGEQNFIYKFAGENLGYGFINGDELVGGWMNSEGHRANILKKDYTTEGLCFKWADTYQGKNNQAIVVQHLAKPLW